MREIEPVGPCGGIYPPHQSALIVETHACLVLRSAVLPYGIGVEVVVGGGVIPCIAAEPVAVVENEFSSYQCGGTDLHLRAVEGMIGTKRHFSEPEHPAVTIGKVDASVAVLHASEGIIVIDIRGRHESFVQPRDHTCHSHTQVAVPVLHMPAIQQFPQLVPFAYLRWCAVVA